MKMVNAIILATLLGTSCTTESKKQSLQNYVSDTITLSFLKKEEAAHLLQMEDEYIRRWSKFDLASHATGISGGKQEYLQYAAAQACDWNNEEKELLQESSRNVNRIIQQKGLKLAFPQEVRLLKSTLKEEEGAGGYTRDTYIVLIDRLLEHPEYVPRLLAHEAFHVLTRNNPDFRRKMYSLIGFSILPQDIEFPEELKERFISNPDVIRRDSYATFTINGEKKDCCMIIYATKPYEGGSFFQYLNIGLVPIDRNTCKAAEKEGRAVIHSIEEAADFYDIVGRNTEYIIDPEEVLADNFAILLTGETENLESPEIIQRMEKACQFLKQ